MLHTAHCLKQGLVSLSCEGQDGEQFQLCRPHVPHGDNPSVAMPSSAWSGKSSRTVLRPVDMAVLAGVCCELCRGITRGRALGQEEGDRVLAPLS